MIDTARKSGIEGRIINVSSVIHSWVKRSAFCFNNMLCGKKYNTIPLGPYLCKIKIKFDCIKCRYQSP